MFKTEFSFEEIATSLLDHFPDGIFLTDRTGRFLYINLAACQSLGYTRNELLALLIFDITPDFLPETWAQNWQDTRRKTLTRVTGTLKRKDGSTFPVQAQIQHLDFQGNPFLFSFVRDLTERNQASELRDVRIYDSPFTRDGQTLIHSTIEDITEIKNFRNELVAYRALVERLPIGVFRSTPGEQGVFLTANQALCDILEVDKPSQLVGRAPVEFYVDAKSRAEFTDLLLKFGEVQRMERALVTAKGKHIHVAMTARKILGDNGQIFFEGGIEDVTARVQAQAESQKALETFRNALHAAPIPILLHRASGKIEHVNSVWLELTGYRADQLKTIDDWIRLAYPEDYVHVESVIENLSSVAGRVSEGDFPIRCADGSQRIWSFFSAPLEPIDAPDRLLISTAIDVTGERQNERKRLQAEAILRSATEGITITDTDCNIEWTNPAFTRITGYSMNEVIGKNPRVLASGRQDAAFYAQMWKQIEQHDRWKGEIWNRRSDGEIYPEWLSISAVRNENHDLINYAAVFTDLTDLKHSQVRLEELQRYDPLTMLPNQSNIIETLSQAINKSRNESGKLAVVMLGLDRFRMINESFSYLVGDQVLQVVAERLNAIELADTFIGRVDGDRFVVIHKLEAGHQADQLMKTLRDQFRQPIKLSDKSPISIQISSGIAHFPDNGTSAAELLRNAEAAMFQSKLTQRGGHTEFRPEYTDATQKKLRLEIDLRNAIDNDTLEVYFQPIVSVQENRIIGAEALARWQHPQHGMILPDHFIPIAEETGLIGPMSLKLLKKAATAISGLGKQTGKPLQLAFNISVSQLRHKNFVESILNCLQQSGLPPELLEIELTESLLMQQSKGPSPVLEQLTKTGISISIDDFGTGFSSLAYLQEIRAQTLKVDKRFIAEIEQHGAGARIVASIIAMANALEMQVISEGVETESQLAYLKTLDCNYYQGYLFSKPLPLEEFRALLAG